MTIFAKLVASNPHLKWSRSKLAVNVLDQAQARDVPLARVNLLICDTWEQVRAEIRVDEEQRGVELKENSPALLVMEESEGNIPPEEAVQQTIDLGWTPVFSLQSQHFFPLSPEHRSTYQIPYHIPAMAHYSKDSGEPVAYILPPLNQAEIKLLVQKWFDPAGRSIFGRDVRTPLATISVSSLLARGQELAGSLGSEENLRSISSLTGGIPVLARNLLTDILNGRIPVPIGDHEGVISANSRSDGIFGYWLQTGLPFILDVIRNQARLTAERPLSEADYAALGGNRKKAVDLAFKFGFLEVTKIGLVIRSKLAQYYIDQRLG